MSEAPVLRGDVPIVFQKSHASAKRLVHMIPDELANAVPDHPLFSYPRTVNLSDGFRNVSSRCFANAINRTAWYLRSLLGEPKCFDTVAYIGTNDIRYFLFMFAAIKVGYKMLFLSPRNNIEGHLNVLHGADCQVFLRARLVNVDDILIKRAMRTGFVPELEELLDESEVDVYPYTKTFDDAHMDPCLVLHTTGSTGLPKPITWKVGILSTYEAWRTSPPVDDYVPTTEIYQQARRAYTSMPLFHTSGLNAGITWALLLGVTLVYGAPQVVPSAPYTDEMHRCAAVDASMGAPSIYEELSRDPECLARFNGLQYVVASGAPLSQNAGALITKHTRVISNLGATETACLQRLSPAVQDWAYFYWHPTHSGIEMREAMDGLYELVLVKKPELELYQGVFNTFPDIQEWSMNDLYARHTDPTKSFLYTYCGRKDDIIVLNNGEKIAPALMEATLMSDALVRGAMVVGKGKFQPAVVIDLMQDPPTGARARHHMVERLSSVISEANVHAPAHGKLDQYHVLFANPKKPFAYLGQGKIQRSRTFGLYENDIEEVYRIADEAIEQFGFSDLQRVDLRNHTSIVHWLVQLITEVADVRELDMDRDFFSAGIDSLHVIKIARELRYQARKADLGQASIDRFLPDMIYRHPTLGQLTEYILRQAGTRSVSKRNIDGLTKEQDPRLADVAPYAQFRSSPSEEVHATLQTYTGGLPKSNKPPLLPPTTSMTVILTGSTGSLGAYLLESLYHNIDVAHIICLNRSPDAAERHWKSSKKRGLSAYSSDRVDFLKADLSKHQFGLDFALYERLRLSVTHIIHNQWPVNFNWALSSFQPYMQGVRSLVDFSYASAHKTFILFVSSVSAVGAWESIDPAPEEPIHDLSVAGEMGYGQSKLISECLLDKAARTSGVQSACCRVGIIAGPVERSKGQWNKHEYIPSIFVSSAALNAFPITFPSRDRVDWLPVDKLADILMEVLKSTSSSHYVRERRGTQIYHVVNPNTTTWSSLAPNAVDLYRKAQHMRPVSFNEWVDTLSQAAAKSDDLEKIPAVKLLEFYRNTTKVELKGARLLTSQKAQRVSKTLRRMEAVSQIWLRTWMQQWGLAEV